MRILLTGASGQVGGALRPLLAAQGTIIAPSSSEFDLSKPETLAERLKDFRPDLIVNPAAYTAVDRAEEQRELAFLVNAKGARGDRAMGSQASRATRSLLNRLRF